MPRIGEAVAADIFEFPSNCCKIDEDDEAARPAVFSVWLAPPGVTVKEVDNIDEACDEFSPTAGIADGGGGGDAPPPEL